MVACPQLRAKEIDPGNRPFLERFQSGAMDNELLQEVRVLRDWMLEVHYFEESHWLAAAVSFPRLCESPVAQEALRRAVTIAFETGHVRVASWLNTTIVSPGVASVGDRANDGGEKSLRMPTLADLA